MSKVICGCSVLVQEIDDGKDDWYLGLCPICLKNDGVYTKSPHWIPDEPRDERPFIHKRHGKNGVRQLD